MAGGIRSGGDPLVTVGTTNRRRGVRAVKRGPLVADIIQGGITSCVTGGIVCLHAYVHRNTSC